MNVYVGTHACISVNITCLRSLRFAVVLNEADQFLHTWMCPYGIS